LTVRTGKPIARLPDGIRIYAIGDVHGRADLLDQVFSKIDADLAAHPTRRAIHVFLGDYVDRGPASRGVLDRLIDRNYSHEAVFLLGNHEVMLLQFLHSPAILKHWRQYGGLDTLMSYGVTAPFNANAEQLAVLAAALHTAMPAEHHSFLNQLVPSFSCGNFFFVHAGVRPGVPLADQRDEDLVWIRDEFLEHEGGFGKVIIHGHTAVPEPDIRFNRINIDTGAYATGRLTCLILEGDQMWFL
jgi:serine/threonine protein phosphatase 1